MRPGYVVLPKFTSRRLAVVVASWLVTPQFIQRRSVLLWAILSLLFGVRFSPCAEDKAVDEKSSALLPGFQKSAGGNEQTLTFTNQPGVRIRINAPAPEVLAQRKNVKLILYALPNGNSIEQTIGKKLKAGDDWHFDIQHIGAQTRFLREMFTHEAVVIAYLEATTAVGKAWPAWRKQNGDQAIPSMVAAVQNHFKNHPTDLVLSGHSGGGSFIFGYLNMLEKIPDNIERITFLDSNYGYETARHKTKLIDWLKASDRHFMTILAYHDSVALLNGKTFVSAAGGTWGKSHLMKADLAEELKLDEHFLPGWENYSSQDGRLKFFLRENPDKKILHTVQVERNGFIHVMVAGTAKENQGYEYMGERAYTRFIAADLAE